MLHLNTKRGAPSKVIIAHQATVSQRKTVNILRMLLEAEQIRVMLKLMARSHLSEEAEAAKRERRRRTSLKTEK